MMRRLVTLVISLASALSEPVQYDGFSGKVITIT